MLGITEEQAAKIIAARPFKQPEDINAKLGQTKKKGGATGISPRIFEDTVDIMAGYADVDRILEECERIGTKLKSAIAAWTAAGFDKGKEVASREGSTALPDDLQDDGVLSLRSRASFNPGEKNHFLSQPSLLSDSVTLKEYQLLGVNWLHLLYNRGLSCILADEMGKASALNPQFRDSLTRMSRSRKDRAGHQFLCFVERTGDQRTSPGCCPVSASCAQWNLTTYPVLGRPPLRTGVGSSQSSHPRYLYRLTTLAKKTGPCSDKRFPIPHEPRSRTDGRS